MSAEGTLLSRESIKASLAVEGNNIAKKKYSQSKKAEEGLRDFQGLMVGLMLSSMRGTVQKNELFNGGQGEEIFQDMLDQEYSKKMSSTDVLGLDATLRRSFRLPMNETFQWAKVEELPTESLQKINESLNSKDAAKASKEYTNEPLAAAVSKKLDSAVKRRALLEDLPPELITKVDEDFLNNWKSRREEYLNEKGYSGKTSVGLKNLNKELLLTVFGELSFENKTSSVMDYQRGRAAYKKVSQLGE